MVSLGTGAQSRGAASASLAAPMVHLHVSIDRLVLAGFPSTRPERVQEAFQQEFSRLALENTGAWVGTERCEPLPPLTLRLKSMPSSRALGQELARALVDALLRRKGEEK